MVDFKQAVRAVHLIHAATDRNRQPFTLTFGFTSCPWGQEAGIPGENMQTHKGPKQDLNTGPSYCEATVLTTTTPYCPSTCYVFKISFS